MGKYTCLFADVVINYGHKNMRHELLDKAVAAVSGVFKKRGMEASKATPTQGQEASKPIHYNIHHMFDVTVYVDSPNEDFFPPHGKRIS